MQASIQADVDMSADEHGFAVFRHMLRVLEEVQTPSSSPANEGKMTGIQSKRPFTALEFKRVARLRSECSRKLMTPFTTILHMLFWNDASFVLRCPSRRIGMKWCRTCKRSARRGSKLRECFPGPLKTSYGWCSEMSSWRGSFKSARMFHGKVRWGVTVL